MPWFYAEGTPQRSERRGPLDEASFEALARSGRLRRDTLVWQSGMPDWLPLSEVRPDLLTASAELSAPPPIAFCSLCGRTESPENLVPFGDQLICAVCKPRFAQGLAAGLDPVSRPMRYAGFWIRFGARIIDTMLMFVIQVALMSFLALAGAMDLVAVAAFGFINFFVGPAYEVLMTTHYGATLGKMALGLRIQRLDGSPLTSGRMLGRYFAQVLSGLIVMIGYLMAAFDSRKQSLHDRICDTVVVYKT